MSRNLALECCLPEEMIREILKHIHPDVVGLVRPVSRWFSRNVKRPRRKHCVEKVKIIYFHWSRVAAALFAYDNHNRDVARELAKVAAHNKDEDLFIYLLRGPLRHQIGDQLGMAVGVYSEIDGPQARNYIGLAVRALDLLETNARKATAIRQATLWHWDDRLESNIAMIDLAMELCPKILNRAGTLEHVVRCLRAEDLLAREKLYLGREEKILRCFADDYDGPEHDIKQRLLRLIQSGKFPSELSGSSGVKCCVARNLIAAGVSNVVVPEYACYRCKKADGGAPGW
jgi:hypothetical protein